MSKELTYSPSKSSLSSRRESRLSFRSCFSISWLILFCSIASSLIQHAIVGNTPTHRSRGQNKASDGQYHIQPTVYVITTESNWSSVRVSDEDDQGILISRRTNELQAILLNDNALGLRLVNWDCLNCCLTHARMQRCLYRRPFPLSTVITAFDSAIY